MPVLMELKRIIINEIHDQQIILLNEVEGERAFPIVIGMFEALSIERECYEVTLYSEDRDEGLAAFAEGRPPKYKGN